MQGVYLRALEPDDLVSEMQAANLREPYTLPGSPHRWDVIREPRSAASSADDRRRG